MKAIKQTRIIHSTAEVREMTTAEIKRLRAKALDLGIATMIPIFDAELDARPERKGGRVARKPARILADLCDRAAELAKSIGQVGDINSSHCHAVLGSNGGPKVSGLEINGAVSFERYISQRVGENIAALTIRLEDSEPEIVVTIGDTGFVEPLGTFSPEEFEEAAALYRSAIADIVAATKTEE